MRKLVVLGIALSFVTAASADFFDDFDSYADQAAFDAVYTQIYPTVPLLLDQTMGYSDGQSVNPLGPNNNYERRAYMNLGAEYDGTDAQPLVFEFMFKLDDAIDWWSREYFEIRGYTGVGYADGDLQELIALGVTSSGVDTTMYNARVMNGAGWVNLTTKTTDWVKLSAYIKTATVELFVDDNLFQTSARPAGVTFDCVVLGSGLSTRVNTHFDDLNVEIVPEPASLMLLALGALALRRR
ncbi:MAG: PEP-CTERM sorting domain-containing protein [Planctomycetes bacterium]|nr:PEP-CTERM sorting domain-containing protein [Planctomycetota bacterium]